MKKNIIAITTTFALTAVMLFGLAKVGADVYTVDAMEKVSTVEYTGVSGENYVAKVYSNAEETSFQVETLYYDEEVTLRAEKLPNGTYRVIDCGFLGTDGSEMVNEAVEENNWENL